jgi:hypothetical protein
LTGDLLGIGFERLERLVAELGLMLEFGKMGDFEQLPDTSVTIGI